MPKQSPAQAATNQALDSRFSEAAANTPVPESLPHHFICGLPRGKSIQLKNNNHQNSTPPNHTAPISPSQSPKSGSLDYHFLRGVDFIALLFEATAVCAASLFAPDCCVLRPHLNSSEQSESLIIFRPQKSIAQILPPPPPDPPQRGGRTEILR